MHRRIQQAIVGSLVVVVSGCPAPAEVEQGISRLTMDATMGVMTSNRDSTDRTHHRDQVATPQTNSATIGIARPGLPFDPTVVDRFTDIVGARPSTVHWFHAFSEPLAVSDFDELAARDTTMMITWEPWETPLAEIAAGTHDAAIDDFATAIEAHQHQVQIRFAHEMNGNWYPWSETRDPERQGEYVAAYRHVVDRFRRLGVTEAAWVWSPNVIADWTIPLDNVYPGDDYVDLVGIDGYNWGATDQGAGWVMPDELFVPTIRAVEALTPLPIVITETASTELGGDKAAWITALGELIEREERVRGVIWFDYQKETDWRIRSSAESAAAFSALAERLGG